MNRLAKIAADEVKGYDSIVIAAGKDFEADIDATNKGSIDITLRTYEPFLDPIINFFTMPFLIIGVALIHVITGSMFTMISMFGMVPLAFFSDPSVSY